VVAKSAGTRSVTGKALPLYRPAELASGASGEGPAVIEDDFFTALLDGGWCFEINEAGDLLLQRA
jgi:N-methylhydantoinase A